MHTLFEAIGLCLAALALLVVAFVVNSVRLAVQFDRTAERAALAMTLDPTDCSRNLAAIKREARGLADLGISAAKMMEAYSIASVPVSENGTSRSQSWG
jgi:hypothetical protein